MNKEVIYLEPEDDITDILTKLQQAEQKLVALVPPKKATMLRSAVNMKLVARVAKECEKVVVIVTVDPAIVKMAIAARIPVAKSLQSRPVIPTEENVRAVEAAIQVIDGETGEISEEHPARHDARDRDGSTDRYAHGRDSRSDYDREDDRRRGHYDDRDDYDEHRAHSRNNHDDRDAYDERHARGGHEDTDTRRPRADHDDKNSFKLPSRDSKSASGHSSEKKSRDMDFDEKSLQNGRKNSDKAKKPGLKSQNPFGKPHHGAGAPKWTKWLLVGVPAVLIVAVIMIWAFVFAPAASIAISITSTSTNISENVNLTTDATAEDLANGTLLAVEQKLDQKYTEKFTPTGKEDHGDKAEGYLDLAFSFTPRDEDEGLEIEIPEGTIFSTLSGLRFVATSSYEFEFDGDRLPSGCSMTRCSQTGKIKVEAAEPGTDYNLRAISSWNTYHDTDVDISVNNYTSITGGTSEMVDVVSQEDIDKLAEQLLSSHTDEGRKFLYEDVASDAVVIDNSFKAEVTAKTSSPEVGAEPGEGSTPTATVTVTYSVVAVKKSTIADYIRAKHLTSSDQQLYSIGNPYFERFSDFTQPVRLKTTIETGPIVTEEQIFDKAHGKKIGEVQSILRTMNGVGDVEIRTPYFWVTTVPNERDRVTIHIKSAATANVPGNSSLSGAGANANSGADDPEAEDADSTEEPAE